MNEFSDNPFFFFVDNAHPMFPMDAYQGAGKIIELSDTGCDAISPSSFIEEKNNQNLSYHHKTHHHDGSSFRKAFDQITETNKEELKKKRNTKRNVLPKDKELFLRKSERKEFTKERSKIVDKDINEKIDQWERNIADFEKTLLRDQRNSTNDYENDIIDSDLIFVNISNDSDANKKTNLKKKMEENETRKKFSHSYKNINESKSITGLSRSRNSNDFEDSNKKNRFSSVSSRSSQKQKDNKSKIFSNDIKDNANARTKFPLVSNVSKKKNEKLKDFNDGIRKMIDRGIDKDSISNNSDTLDNLENNITNNLINLNNDKNKFKQNIEKLDNLNRQRFNRDTNKKMVSETRTISKSADFDKAKHRANMAKRYANKSWMKSNKNDTIIPKIQEKENFIDKQHFVNANNDNSRSKVVSKSAGSYSRNIEKKEKSKIKSEEKLNMALSHDDNFDALKKSKRRNKNRISDNSLSRSVRAEEEEEEEKEEKEEENENENENDKVGIQRKDLEKIGAIFLASSLRKSGKLFNSKTNDYENDNSKNNKSNRLEIIKTKDDGIDRKLESSKIHSTSNLYTKLSDKSEKLVKSKIPIAISRLNKQFDDNYDDLKLLNYNRSRSRSRLRSNENKQMDESTSTDMILVDKSNNNNNNNNNNTKSEDNDKLGTRLNSLNTKFEEFRKRKMDVESKVFKIAKDVKEKRRKEFEKCGLREPMKKLPNVSKEMVDIAVTILENDSKGKTKSSNVDNRDFKNDYRNHVEVGYSKPYSLRSSMYSKYLPNHFTSKRYQT